MDRRVRYDEKSRRCCERATKSTHPTRFFTKHCCRSIIKLIVITIVFALVLAIIVNVFNRIDPHVGRMLQLLCSLIAPLPVAAYFFWRHGRSVSLGQAFLTFSEAIMWMFPLIGFLLITRMDDYIANNYGEIKAKYCSDFNVTRFLSRDFGEHLGFEYTDDDSIINNAPIRLTPGKVEELGCSAPAVHWFGFNSDRDGIQFNITKLPNEPDKYNTGCKDGWCHIRTMENRKKLVEQLRDENYVNKTALQSVPTIIEGRRRTLESTAFSAFVRAALLEESLKYIAVRNIVFSSRVVDPGSLLVYSMSGATGFAMIENLMFTLYTTIDQNDSLTLNVLFFRMLSSVPLHLMLGLLIGSLLAYRRFFRYGQIPILSCILILILPILFHGSYDFILMGGFLFFEEDDLHEDNASTMLQLSYALFFLANCVSFFGWIVVRILWLRLAPICHVDVQKLLVKELVVSPLAGRCLCVDWQLRGLIDPIRRLLCCWKSSNSDRPAPRIEPNVCQNCHAAIYIHSHLDSECPYCYMKQPPIDIPSRRTTMRKSTAPRNTNVQLPPPPVPAIELSPMDEEQVAVAQQNIEDSTIITGVPPGPNSRGGIEYSTSPSPVTPVPGMITKGSTVSNFSSMNLGKNNPTKIMTRTYSGLNYNTPQFESRPAQSFGDRQRKKEPSARPSESTPSAEAITNALEEQRRRGVPEKSLEAARVVMQQEHFRQEQVVKKIQDPLEKKNDLPEPLSPNKPEPNPEEEMHEM